MNFPAIPFPVDQVTTDITGHTLGNRYVDARGRIFVLWQIDPALTRDTFATGEVAVLKANHVVTNDVSDGVDATYPVFAGVALGSLAESTGTTTVRYGLFLVKGRATLTITDGNVVLATANLLAVDTGVDGGCLAIDETSTGLTAARTTSGIVGVALADDDANNDVNAFVSSVLFG